MENNDKKINLNIQPQANIYALFSRLSYEEWYALAEFVDNSTASYYNHKEELENSHFDKLQIDINYDATTDTITIEDNAYGMEIEEFKRAILLGDAPKIKSRNEFGYGLKTAATWFGNHWTVKSTQMNSNRCFEATIDIDELVSSKKNDTDIIISSATTEEHYTKITITKLNRKLNTNKIKKNIINVLNNMYRRDLKSGNIEIIYNGITLNFGDYPILNFRNKDWKKDICIDFDFDGKHYNAKGFVGIMEPGSYEKTGFALFRNNRAIICNYKPSEIFGSQAQTQVSLKLFGEIDMDCFEVNQAKDGFSWSHDLEEKFIETLKNNISEFIVIAKMSKKERDAEIEIERIAEEQTSTDNKTSDTNKTEKQDNDNPKNISNQIPNTLFNLNDNDQVKTDKKIMDDKINNDNLIQPKNLLVNSLSNEFNLTVENKVYNISWNDSMTSKFLYSFDAENNSLIINLKHEFVAKITDDNCKKMFSQIILSYVLSEQYAKQSGNEIGYVKASAIHNKLNEILSNIK